MALGMLTLRIYTQNAVMLSTALTSVIIRSNRLLWYFLFVFRHWCHIMSPKFLKFERVQNGAKKFWIVQKLKLSQLLQIPVTKIGIKVLKIFWTQPFTFSQFLYHFISLMNQIFFSAQMLQNADNLGQI